VSKKHWMAMVMVSAAACTGGGDGVDGTSAADGSGGAARRAQDDGVVFVERAGGFRAEPAGQQIEIVEGLIAVAAAPAAPAAGAKRNSVQHVGAEVTLETTAARRGATSLDVTARGSALVAPDLVETARGELTERLRSNRDGAEQSWWFDRAPGAQGDLVVEITPTGVRYLESTAAGLRFERAGELSLRYSHGIWVEADGDRWEVPATFIDGRIQLTVPASVLTSSSFPAVLDPQIIVTPIGGQPG
jgi:hypothetical protein